MVQFQLSAFQKQIKIKNIPKVLEIIFLKEYSNYNTFQIFKDFKENLPNLFKISHLKQPSKGKKNAVL